MVDFRKRLSPTGPKTSLAPTEIYETLDRASDKGELRSRQKAILKEWHEKYRDHKDVIIKLHTGQGKTLIGLLILQSKLLETQEPVVYLCPNNHLIKQTCAQADQFGVAYTTAEALPEDFLDGKRLLVTSVQKLFNGMTQFRLGAKSIPVAAILMDDSHACVDSIRDACVIRLDHAEQAYRDVLDLFTPELELQGSGTLADIKRKDPDSLLCVPYWDWIDKHLDVVRILGDHLKRHSDPKDRDQLRFVWPILRDILRDCQCVISGSALEISPYLPPVDMFGSYYKAKLRVFMSATVTDDSFLIKGLRLAPETVQNPLVYRDEKWSGEKMILIPSMIDDALGKLEIQSGFAKSSSKRQYGVVVLTSSGIGGKQWQAAGATVASKEDIYDRIEALRKGQHSDTLVLVNRYDGVDLPDNMCRILILDNKPYFESLVDLHMESCIPESESVAIKTARKIEQGLGRSVRGEKDYCAIIIIGSALVKFVRSRATLRHFSLQTKRQIELGLEIAEMAESEIKSGKTPIDSLHGLIGQCLGRDPGWKEFYVQEMNALTFDQKPRQVAPEIAMELAAELKYQDQAIDSANGLLQELIDQHVKEDAEKGWYLQHMARYTYIKSKSESNALQIAAHAKNKYLLKPKNGMKVTKIHMVSQKRAENIISFIKSCHSAEELMLTTNQILANLAFGVHADKFEQAFNNLGHALGFECERPDKSWKEGPDNLWALRDGEYFVVECKNCVDLQRAEINKDESGQMNNACAWFERHYPGTKYHPIMVIPPNMLGNAAGFTRDVVIMREKHLSRLLKNVRSFFQEFKTLDFASLSEAKVQEFVDVHGLSVDQLIADYSEKPRSY